MQLVGLPGSGRSTLARRVAGEVAAAGHGTLWVKGIAPLRGRALTALALAGVPIDPVSASTLSALALARATDALSELVGESTAVLIDDVEYLDVASGGVIVAAHVRRPFPILFTHRPGRERDELASALASEFQPAVRLSMATASFEDVQRLVHEALPGTVDPAGVAQIAILSGGLPRLVCAIVDSARRNGSIRQANGMWTVTGELWDDQLLQVIYPLIQDLGEDDIASLAAIGRAAGDSRSIEAIVTSRPGDVRTLREAGLLRVASRASGCPASVFPPLLAEYLLRRAPLDAYAVDSTGRAGGRQSEPWSWRERLPMGAEASEYAARLGLYWRGEVAARRSAWEQERDSMHAAQLLTAMDVVAAEPGEIATVLGHVSLTGDDPAACAAVAARSAVHRAIVQRDVDGAFAELDEDRALIPDADGYLSAFKAHLAFLNGHAREAADLLAQAKPHLAVCREAMTGVTVESLIASGKTTEALGILATDDCRDPMFVGHSAICEGLARVLGDDVTGGVEWALDHLGNAIETLEPRLIDGHAYTAAVGMILLGRLDDLEDLVDIVFRFPTGTPLQRHFRAGLFSLTAVVRNWEGEADQARRLAAQATALSTCIGPYPGMWHSQERYLDPAAGPGPLWETVRERLANGYLAAAVFSAVSAAERCADVAGTACLIEAGMGAESAIVRALTGYVAALAAADTDQLAAVATTLRATCGPIYAMRAAISRALLLRRQGDAHAATAAVGAAWHEAGGLGGRCPGLFARFNAVMDLTPREREVIPLVARGLASSAVADEVEITRRTAETHTLAAYRKIGVRNRRELCDALATWLVI